MNDKRSLKDYEFLIEQQINLLDENDMLESKANVIASAKESLYSKDEFESTLTKYQLVFEEGFPGTPMLGMYDKGELVVMLKACLDKGKTLEELGYYTSPPPDVLI